MLRLATVVAAFALALCEPLDLTKDNFDEVTESGKVVMVKFYAPWCGHCKKLAPDWDRLSETVNAEKVAITKIDCTVETEVCGKYGVQGYPTIKYWTKDTKKPEDYEGSRDFDDIKDFIDELLGGGCSPDDTTECSDKEREFITTWAAKEKSEIAANATKRIGSCFVSHGGGPGFFVPSFNRYGLGPDSAYTKKLRTMYEGQRPSLIVVVTAHWECYEKDTVFVSTNPSPGLYFDYGGFPSETYKYKYPAPGAPEAALKVGEYLKGVGVTAKYDDTRGYDHGVFIPLMLMFPEADIPVLMMSVNGKHDAGLHLKIGEALSPLLDEGVLLMASGMSEHAHTKKAEHDGFSKWLLETVTGDMPREERRQKLIASPFAPHFRRAHPRPEHFIPLHVAAGASDYLAGTASVAEPATVYGPGHMMYSFAFP